MTADGHQQAGVSAGPLLAEVEAIAREAGELLRSRFGDPGEVRDKGDRDDDNRVFDVVTELDFATEHLIVDRINQLNPAAAVLAEEGGVKLGEGAEPRGDLSDIEDLWIVDPLDGTVNYAHSLPYFAVSIARYRRGVPVAGSIYDPMLDEMFSFDEHDALLNGKPIRVSDCTSLDKAMLGIGSAGRHTPTVLRAFQGWRRIGSAALCLAYIASGRYDAYIQLGDLFPWDVAAGVPLVLRAGGVVTSDQFAEWTFPLEGRTGVIAANSAMYDDVHALLQD